VTIGGQTFEFTASDPETLESQINGAREVYRHLENNRDSAAVDEPTVARELEAARQQKLYDDVQNQLAFQRGEIDAKTYIERTGAVGDWLASQGIDIDQLREQTQQHEAQSFEQSWADAVQEFLKDSDWPGGSRNMHLCQTQLTAMGLEHAEDKVAALQAAYNELRKNGTLFEPEVTQAAVLESMKNASPAELVELWKQNQPGASYGDGTTANAQFLEMFRRK
jgi:hypothetical protein